MRSARELIETYTNPETTSRDCESLAEVAINMLKRLVEVRDQIKERTAPFEHETIIASLLAHGFMDLVDILDGKEQDDD